MAEYVNSTKVTQILPNKARVPVTIEPGKTVEGDHFGKFEGMVKVGNLGEFVGNKNQGEILTEAPVVQAENETVNESEKPSVRRRRSANK